MEGEQRPPENTLKIHVRRRSKYKDIEHYLILNTLYPEYVSQFRQAPTRKAPKKTRRKTLKNSEKLPDMASLGGGLPAPRPP